MMVSGVLNKLVWSEIERPAPLFTIQLEHTGINQAFLKATHHSSLLHSASA